MIARTIRVDEVPWHEVERDDGWEAPPSWRIVSSEYVQNGNALAFYRVTLVKS